MTEQQFNDLKTGQEITYEGNVYKVVNIYAIRRIIMATGVIQVEIPFRYEDVELVVKDELVEYLNATAMLMQTERTKEIRSIVRKEVIDELKFPTIHQVYFKERNNSNQDFYEWFVNEVKTLNS
jgi:hypothetical protein